MLVIEKEGFMLEKAIIDNSKENIETEILGKGLKRKAEVAQTNQK